MDQCAQFGEVVRFRVHFEITESKGGKKKRIALKCSFINKRWCSWAEQSLPQALQALGSQRLEDGELAKSLGYTAVQSQLSL